MKRFHILRDGTTIGSTQTREEAIERIRLYQSRETHPILRSEYSIIFGEEEFIRYPSLKKATRTTDDLER